MADTVHRVDAAHSLDAIANDIRVSADSIHIVQFAAFANVGHFVLNVSTAATRITFERAQPGDSAVQITDANPLFDIKKAKGRIVFHNLAFKLAASNAVFIAGADQSQKNGDLYLDSCFLFGDNVNSSFLNWFGDANSTVAIYRSFLVARSGSDTLNLTSANVDLRNNEINFTGLVNAKSSKALYMSNNTVNRAQFNCDGTLGGSDYRILDNLFAQRSKQNSLGFGGDTAYYPIYLNAFNENSPSVRRNVAYQTAWRAFEPPSGGRFSDTTNKLVAPRVATDTTELWNWYAAFPGHGFDYGLNKAPDAYNVFPGDSLFAGTLPDFNSAIFGFDAAEIPRRMAPQWQGANLDSTIDPHLRLLWPGKPGLTLGDTGTFVLDSMVIAGLSTSYKGNPILLSYFQGAWHQPLLPETAGSLSGRFVNRFAKGIYFHPAYYCNTPRGKQVKAGGINAPDRLLFSGVDSAGGTVSLVKSSPPVRNDLRDLHSKFAFTTFAKVAQGGPADSMTFGTAIAGVAPYRQDSVYWWLKDQNALVAAKQQDTILVATYKALTGVEAYLVEKLSVPKGGSTFPVHDGFVSAKAAQGYQVDIDSTGYQPDAALFGNSTLGVRCVWSGRGDSDSVSVHFRKPPGAEAFRDSSGVITPVAATDEAGGYARIDLGKADANKVFFMGVEYNVAANRALDTTINGVSVKGLVSSTPGKLVILPVGPALLGQDTDFANTRFLGGDSLAATSLTVTSPTWRMSFALAPPGIQDTTALEVWSWDGSAWTRITQVDPIGKSSQTVQAEVPKSARAVVAVERLAPAANYVDLSLIVIQGGSRFFFASSYKDSLNRPVRSYVVEIKAVDQDGNVQTTLFPAGQRQVIGQNLTVDRPAGGIFAYRLIYYDSTGKEYGPQPRQPVPLTAWKSLNLPPPYYEDIWNTIGFPAGGSITKMLKSEDTRHDSVQHVDLLLRLKTVNGATQYDTIPNPDTVKVNPGDAYLSGSTWRKKIQLDSTFQYLPGGPATITRDSGWQLFANPFPFALPMVSVKSNLKTTNPLQWLEDISVSLPTLHRSYGWRLETGALKPFIAYAYHFRKGESLTIDPLANDASNGVAKQAASSGASAPALEVSVSGAGVTSSMLLASTPGQDDLPFLPSPASDLEMRLGGGAGFMRKGVSDWHAVDEPLTLRAAQAMQVTFALRPMDVTGGPAVPRPQAVRLVDLADGRVFDDAELAALPLQPGSRAYRLLAGDEGFVRARTHELLAGAPREILLSQNFPNPFGRVTRILLDWPAAQSDRRAVLEVFDTRGRRVERLDLGRVSMGRQTLTLDAGAWTPGVYTYRLTVTGAETVRLQKRMLVAK